MISPQQKRCTAIIQPWRLQRLCVCVACVLVHLCTCTLKRPWYFSGSGVKTIARPSSPETGFCLCACSGCVMLNNTGDSRIRRHFAECVRNMVTAFAYCAWQRDYRHNWIFKVKRGRQQIYKIEWAAIYAVSWCATCWRVDLQRFNSPARL